MAADPKLAVAQATVTMINPELGPSLSRLPDELLIYIFSIVATTLFPPNSRLLNPEIGIDPDTFAIINRHSALKRIRNVSKTFCAFFMQAFYENLHFICKKPKISSYWMTAVQTIRAPMLPPSQMRHFLRTARIEITLDTSYQGDYEPYPGNPDRRMRRRHKYQNLEQLMALCPSARVLARLTHPASGFCNLSHLELAVHVDLTGHPLDDEFLSVLEEANFVVKAKKVTLSVTDSWLGKEAAMVKERITVVETG
jgi:hypothetical protein